MGEKNQKKGYVESKQGEDTVGYVAHLLYRYFGRPLLRRKNFKDFFDKNIYNERYERILRESNLKILPEEYFVSIYIMLTIVIFIVVIGSAMFFLSNILLSSMIFYGGILAICVLGIFLYNYPVLLSRKRGKEIDASIPFVLPYMKILSKELSLAKMIDIIDDFLIYKEVKIEFKKIKHYSNFLGYDINTSIRESMNSCPSKQLADIMNDLVTISNSGGNIHTYLVRKAENLNEEINAIEKKNIDTLLIYSQIYVVLLLIAPLFFAIMSSILNMVGASSEFSAASGSTDTVTLLIMLLVVLPFLYAAFMMLIFYSKPLYSRLKPMEND